VRVLVCDEHERSPPSYARRKALAPEGLLVSVGALDGKATALATLNHPLVQNPIDGQVVPFGLVRTVTCSLVSAAAA
jgi:hypothetical protein